MDSDSKIALAIRKIIFEKYNDPDTRFTNDEILVLLKESKIIPNSTTIDDLEDYFTHLVDCELLRNIAQNFTTIWFKLFTPLSKHNCNSCNLDIYLGETEDQKCPNSLCGSMI